MQLHDEYRFEYQVSEKDLAATIGLDVGDNFPPVLATARMVALMELACARLMADQLQEGQLSVGVGVDIKHIAPTPAGATIQVHCRYTCRAGKLYQFSVEVSDGKGVAGVGNHSRAIINNDELVAVAATRG